jgi:large subunit ribosomal protein L1
MDDMDLAVNAHAVLSAVEKKLPSGEKNLKRVIVKTTMGKPVKQIEEVKKKIA